MNRTFALMLALIIILLAGCAQGAPEETTEAAPMMQLGNPWKDYATLGEAEAACGFSLGVPEAVGVYQAEKYRVLNGYLLEVIYAHDGHTVTVRKARGSEDISGDYNQYDEIAIAEYASGSATFRGDVSVVLFTEDWSYSLYCPDGSWEGTKDTFVEAIME